MANRSAILPGRERTQAEYSAPLKRAGLRFERLVPTHSPFQILERARLTAGRIVVSSARERSLALNGDLSWGRPANLPGPPVTEWGGMR